MGAQQQSRAILTAKAQTASCCAATLSAQSAGAAATAHPSSCAACSGPASGCSAAGSASRAPAAGAAPKAAAALSTVWLARRRACDSSGCWPGTRLTAAAMPGEPPAEAAFFRSLLL